MFVDRSPGALARLHRRIRRYMAAAFAACVLGPAYGEMILLPTRTEGVAGDPVRVDLLVTNETDANAAFTVPERVAVRVSNAEQSGTLQLQRAATAPAGRIELAPRTLLRIPYEGVLPAEVRGAVTLRALELRATAAMMDIAPPAEPVAAAPSSELPAETGTRTSVDEAPASPTAAFAAALSGYEPVYFAAGLDGSLAKFQLSLKFRFFNEKAGLAQRVRFLDDLYFGYTQTSLWDLNAPSAPFEDTAYRPRLFYSNGSVWTPTFAPLRLGVESGLGHESNGRGGTESRSINLAYVRPSVVLGRPGDWQLTFAPMVYDYLEKSDNPDIPDYRGYVDWYASLGKADSAQLATTYRHGTQGWSVQLDLTYPLRSVALGNLNGYLLFQYFDGWGETILRYNQRSDAQYRLGLMFVR
jgi:outer membrane phospholipase A